MYKNSFKTIICLIFFCSIIKKSHIATKSLPQKQQKLSKNNKSKEKIIEKIVVKHVYPSVPSAVWLMPSETWRSTKKLDHEKLITVIIPSYKNALWYAYNLDSVFAQKYENYRVIYIDDCSPDNTGNLVEEFVKSCKQEHRVNLIKNKERCGALGNIYKAIYLSDPNSIIVTLDGDDWLAHCNVFQMLNEVYDDPNVWLTYGQYKHFPHNEPGYCKELPLEVINNNTYRSYEWVTSHLRTFYAWLFKEIKTEDLMLNGKFFPMAWDIAFMLPMLEMSSGRFAFISDVTYIYNIANVINDFKVDGNLQVKLECAIRLMKQYNRINQ